MSETAATLALFGSFAGLLLLRVPIAFALGLATLAFCGVTGTSPLVVVQKTASQASDTTLLAIPLFILCGQIMTRGGMANRLVDLANALVGRVRGGLAMVNVVASMFFGGVSGSSVADTSSVGSLLIPSMVSRGYHRDFAVAVTVTSSTQGIIIPPSHNAILFALAAGGAVSIRGLFLAGYLPGLCIGSTLMAISWLLATRRGYPSEPGVGFAALRRATLDAALALCTPFLIIVPIALGWVPAHQAAAIAVAWSAVVSTAIYRSLPPAAYRPILHETAKTSSMVLILIATAASFGEALTLLHVPTRLTALLVSVTDHRVVALLLLNAILLVLGMVMDMAPLIVILTPILLPVAEAIGLHPVHFGVILLLNLAIGLCTPPVGSTLFVGCAIGGIKLRQALRGLWPFYAGMVVVLLVVTFVPGLSLWLPEWAARDFAIIRR